MAASGGFSIGFALTGLHATITKSGDVLVRGKVGSANVAPPGVHLLTYQLRGKITDAAGQPVAGAVVITRTLDRDFWTRSDPSNAQGDYSSFFTASDETFNDPVTMSVGVAYQSSSYGGALGTNVLFARDKSSVLNIQLGAGTAYKIASPAPISAAIYSGLAIGVTAGGRVITPRREQWPAANGTFSMLLPSTVRGRTLEFFQSQQQIFSRYTAVPGGPIDLNYWPHTLVSNAPTGLATLTVPRG